MGERTRPGVKAYDAVGNRVSQPGVPYVYNISNEMTSREGVPYAHDANGNTLNKTNSGGATSYAWDFENSLTTVTKPDGSVLSFRYDPFGRRIQKISPSGTTTYVYDGDNIIEELNGAAGTLSGPAFHLAFDGGSRPMNASLISKHCFTTEVRGCPRRFSLRRELSTVIC